MCGYIQRIHKIGLFAWSFFLLDLILYSNPRNNLGTKARKIWCRNIRILHHFFVYVLHLYSARSIWCRSQCMLSPCFKHRGIQEKIDAAMAVTFIYGTKFSHLNIFWWWRIFSIQPPLLNKLRLGRWRGGKNLRISANPLKHHLVPMSCIRTYRGKGWHNVTWRSGMKNTWNYREKAGE